MFIVYFPFDIILWVSGSVLIMVLVLMNVFIAVVSEVYAKAQEESIAKFDASLELHLASNMHPKLVSQAEMTLMTHNWHAVLKRECSEVDDDHEPSTTADVQHLLTLMDSAQHTLKHISAKMFPPIVNIPSVAEPIVHPVHDGKTILHTRTALGERLLNTHTRKINNNDDGDNIPELMGINIGDGFFSTADEFDDRQHQKIKRKMTDYKYKQ